MPDLGIKIAHHFRTGLASLTQGQVGLITDSPVVLAAGEGVLE